jgi:hypothetical protein
MALKFLDIFKARATEKQMSPETAEILQQAAIALQGGELERAIHLYSAVQAAGSGTDAHARGGWLAGGGVRLFLFQCELQNYAGHFCGLERHRAGLAPQTIFVTPNA